MSSTTELVDIENGISQQKKIDREKTELEYIKAIRRVSGVDVVLKDDSKGGVELAGRQISQRQLSQRIPSTGSVPLVGNVQAV